MLWEQPSISHQIVSGSTLRLLTFFFGWIIHLLFWVKTCVLSHRDTSIPASRTCLQGCKVFLSGHHLVSEWRNLWNEFPLNLLQTSPTDETWLLFLFPQNVNSSHTLSFDLTHPQFNNFQSSSAAAKSMDEEPRHPTEEWLPGSESRRFHRCLQTLGAAGSDFLPHWEKWTFKQRSWIIHPPSGQQK